MALALFAFAIAGPSPADAARRGTLSVRVGGLPEGEKATVRVRGPGMKRTVRSAKRTVVLKKLRPGAYRVSIRPVTFTRAHRPSLRKGTTARSSAGLVPVRVRSGKRAKLRLTYDSVVNPVTTPKGASVVGVGGPAGDPSSLTLRGRSKIRKGAIISIPPRPDLPRGVLSRVTSVKATKGSTTLSLRAASAFEVAPSLQFDVPAGVRAATRVPVVPSATCKPTAVVQDIFTRQINDVRFTGGWNTKSFFGKDVPIGVQFEVAFSPRVGIALRNLVREIGGSCSVSVALNGMAGPIPLTGSIGGSLNVSAERNAELTASGSTRVRVGAKTVGVPPGPVVWAPHVSVDSPTFELGGSISAQAKAGFGLDLTAGIGNSAAGNVSLKSGASVDFTAKPGTGCSWDFNAGSFAITGDVLGWEVSSPSTPPLFSRNLWRRPCGIAPPRPPAPAPAPAPAPKPEVRARMTWDTATDVDLYIWDDDGNLAYYRDEQGILNARLVEDITPGYGPEEFRETNRAGRHFTYGVCMYRDETPSTTAAKLAITDPNGRTRTVEHTLGFEGDSAVIASSPGVAPYDPGEGWCEQVSRSKRGVAAAKR